MAQRTCELEECDKPHRARGLCATHYNQTYAPDRHRTTRACEACGAEYTTTRTNGRYCSLACRDDVRTGKTLEQRLSERAEREARAEERRTRPRQPKPPPFIPEERECGWCGDAYVAARRAATYCTERCKRRAKGVRRRGREHAAPGAYTWAEVIRIYLDIGGCAYCGNRGEVEPDHVVPLSRGGSNSITNVVPACPPCNSDKRDLSLTEWAADRARRGLPPRALSSRVRHLTHATLAA